MKMCIKTSGDHLDPVKVITFFLIYVNLMGMTLAQEAPDVIILNANGQSAPPSPRTENMLIITEGSGSSQSFIIILPPSLTQGPNVPRIQPMVLRMRR